MVVRDGDAIVGVLSQLDLMAFVASHSHLIALQATQAADVTELKAAARQIDSLIRVLHDDGVRVEVIAGLVGELNRQVFRASGSCSRRRSLRANSCLIVMGSEGRGEQIIKTDQDNALLLRDGFVFEGLEAVTEAFTAALIDFGYPPCPGRHHAEPAAVAPAASRAFGDRCATGSTAAIREGPMNLAIFLDAAAVAGDAALLERGARPCRLRSCPTATPSTRASRAPSTSSAATAAGGRGCRACAAARRPRST